MKIKTVLVAGLAGGIGYVLGARAGQGRYEELKSRADRLARNPQVQETVSNLAESAKKGAAKLPDPVADVVTSVADLATGSGSKDDVAEAAKGAATSAASAAGDAASGLKDKAADRVGGSDDDTADTVVVTPVVTDPDADALDLDTLDALTTPDAPASTLGTDDLDTAGLGTSQIGTDSDDVDGPDATPRRAE